MSTTRGEAQPPRITGCIGRERLYKKLQLAADHRLTLICAPPGFGKTTLAAQFATSTTVPVIWHTLEERERDFPTLYEQLLITLHYVLPDLEASLPAVHIEPAEAAAILTNGLRAVVRQEMLLFMDDVQFLVGAQASEAWLRTFISLLPTQIHLVLVSRSLPALPLAEMVARREVLAIGQEELRFTPGEISELMAVSSGHTETSVETLIERLEGWPAGIILALQPLPQEVEQLFLQGGEGPESLFENLASVMLESQTPGQRNFLLESSTLKRMTPDILTRVLGIRNASRWVAATLDKNLFLTRISGGLAYHTLFRSFLQAEMQRRDPERYAELHRKAAEWMESQEQYEDAFDHYMTAGSFDRAAAMVSRIAGLYYDQDKYETVLKWGEWLEEQELEDVGLLLITAIIHIERLEYEVASAELDHIEVIADRDNDTISRQVATLHRARLHQMQGHYVSAISTAEPLTQLEVDPRNLRVKGLRIIGYSYYQLGRAELGLRYLEDALPLCRESNDQRTLANLLQDLEAAYIRVGRMADASACLQDLVAIRREMGSGSQLALALNDLGYHYHQCGDYREAVLTLEEALGIAAPLRSRRVECYLLWTMADLQRDLGSFNESWLLYNQALEFTANREPGLRVRLLINTSILRRWQGLLDEAQVLAQEASALAQAHKMAVEHKVAQACYWSARGLQGDSALAIDHVLVLAEELREKQALTETAQLLTMGAEMALLQNQRPSAVAHLTAAMQVLNQGASMQPVLAEIVHSTELDALLQSNSARFAALTGRLSVLRSAQHHKPTILRLEDRITTDTVYSLRVHTLGREKVERDGVPVLPADWRASAARELFFYLLFVGPQRREIISLDFWPDSSPSRVRSNFHTTLYRVRQALGENVIMFHGEEYLINPDLDVWCDAHEFEALVKRASAIPVRDARAEDLFRRAVDLYQGDFLPMLEAEWIDATRERMIEGYLAALIGLGRCAEARRDYRQGLRLYKQALKVDPYSEDVHRAVMANYHAQGERQKVYLHYQEMLQLFRQDLASEPTRETVSFARSLLG